MHQTSLDLVHVATSRPHEFLCERSELFRPGGKWPCERGTKSCLHSRFAPDKMGSGVTNIVFASLKLAALNFSLNWTKEFFESLQTSCTENVFDCVM